MDIEKFRLAAPGEGREGHDIKKMHFFDDWEFCRSSLGHLSESLGKMRQGIREGNLKKEHFTGKHTKHHTLGGRAYPVRHYPIAIRLRDRKGRAILCIALNPQSGDFSGAILGVLY